MLSDNDIKIAPSTYYDNVSRGPSKRAAADAVVIELIHQARTNRFVAAFGARKLWLHLRGKGHDVARCTIERLMHAEVMVGSHPGRSERDGKSTRALGAALREHQRERPGIDQEPAVRVESILDEAFTALLALAITVMTACALTGRSRATYYRRLNPPPLKADPVPRRSGPNHHPPCPGTNGQRCWRSSTARNTPTCRSVRSGPGNSMRTGITGQCRRCIGSRGPSDRPANADGWRRVRRRSNPNSWPPARVRCGPGALQNCAAEDSIVEKDFIDSAISRNGRAPHTVHADRGMSMTSKPVSALLSDLGSTRSHSRPWVSNDKPFSEAQFKTLKYVHDFPHHFDSLAEARIFCDGFFTEYDHVGRSPPENLRSSASAPPCNARKN